MRALYTSISLLLVLAAHASAYADNSGLDAVLAKLNDRQPSLRAQGAKEAAERRLRRAIPKLIALLEDDDADVRLAAVDALELLHARAATTRLLVRAQIDPDAAVREAAARAVRHIAPRSFASKLGSADPPPVRPPPLPPLRPRARYATYFTLGATLDPLDTPESLDGNVAWALRWGDIEGQLTLAFPTMRLALRARWLLIAYPRFTPYLVGGAETAFSHGEDNALTTVSAFGGAGVRWYLIPPVFVQLEVAASYALHAPQHTPTSPSTTEIQRFALPITVEVGLELWP